MEREIKNSNPNNKIDQMSRREFFKKVAEVLLETTALSSILSACAAEPEPTPTSIPKPELTPPKEGFKQSPIIICHDSTQPEHPNALLLIGFLIITDQNGNEEIVYETQSLTGSPDFTPHKDGSLSPVKTETSSFVNTELTVDFVYSYETEKGEKKEISINLGGCLVDEKEKDNLNNFFKLISPNKIHEHEASIKEQRLQIRG